MKSILDQHRMIPSSTFFVLFYLNNNSSCNALAMAMAMPSTLPLISTFHFPPLLTLLDYIYIMCIGGHDDDDETLVGIVAS
jgi:hypothetical protein